MAKPPIYADDKKQTDKDRMDEGEGMARREQRDKDDSRAESEGMKRKESGGAAVAAVEKASDKFLASIREIRKRHEGERRDFHGNHREALRQMAARHDKEIASLLDAMGAGEAEQADGAEMAMQAEMEA